MGALTSKPMSKLSKFILILLLHFISTAACYMKKTVGGGKMVIICKMCMDNPVYMQNTC